MAVLAEEKIDKLSRADHIIQGYIEHTDMFLGNYGKSRIKIRVAKVFQGHSLKEGAVVETSTYTWRNEPPVGDYYIGAEKLEKATLVEAYLEKDSSDGYLAPEIFLISTLSDDPQYLVSLRKVIQSGFSNSKKPTGLFGFLAKILGR